jgi:hypothetical protein
MVHTDAPATAVIIGFPGNRLNAADRHQAVAWLGSASAEGYGDVRLHQPEAGNCPEFGEILAIYRAGEPWAAWGIARCGKTLLLWRSSTGETIGSFRSMTDALAAIPPAPRRAHSGPCDMESAC